MKRRTCHTHFVGQVLALHTLLPSKQETVTWFCHWLVCNTNLSNWWITRKQDSKPYFWQWFQINRPWEMEKLMLSLGLDCLGLLEPNVSKHDKVLSTARHSGSETVTVRARGFQIKDLAPQNPSIWAQTFCRWMNKLLQAQWLYRPECQKCWFARQAQTCHTKDAHWASSNPLVALVATV